MKKILLMSLVLMTVVTAVHQTEDENASSITEQKTITFGVTPWTNAVHQKVLDFARYGPEMKTAADAGSVCMGSRGDLDVFIDAWVRCINVFR
jgi:glycine betaine/proline transport system substrate-binding protein